MGGRCGVEKVPTTSEAEISLEVPRVYERLNLVLTVRWERGTATTPGAMVKHRNKLRARAASLSTRGGCVAKKEDEAGALSRRRRKRAKVRRLDEKRRAFIEREVERRGGDTKKSIGEPLSLDALQGALQEAAADDGGKGVKQVGGAISARARKHRVREESEQLTSVRRHPAFQADPVEALRQHLLNTVCATPGAIPAALEGDRPGARKERVKARVGATVAMEASKQAMAATREEARERVREKRQRKTQMQHAAGVLRKTTRGRIGEKRAKLV